MSDDLLKSTDVKHVYEIEEQFNNPWHTFLPGFYFSDETEQLNGPYPTKEDAVQAFDNYCKYYL